MNAETHQELARQLRRLLREPSLISVWVDADTAGQTRYTWFRVGDDMKAMYEMSRDPVMVKGLRSMPKDKLWITVTTAGEGPAIRILGKVAKQVAKLWYEKGDSWSAFYWLADFLLCVRRHHSSALRMCTNKCANSLMAKHPREGKTSPHQGYFGWKSGRKSKLISPEWI